MLLSLYKGGKEKSEPSPEFAEAGRRLENKKSSGEDREDVHVVRQWEEEGRSKVWARIEKVNTCCKIVRGRGKNLPFIFPLLKQALDAVAMKPQQVFVPGPRVKGRLIRTWPDPNAKQSRSLSVTGLTRGVVNYRALIKILHIGLAILETQ